MRIETKKTIPKELRDLPQWCWATLDIDPETGRRDKAPKRPMGRGRDDPYADSTDPETWGTFEAALAAAITHGESARVGFMFSVGDPYMVIDLDAPDSETDISNRDLLLRAFDYTYTEVSQSGEGYHIIGRGHWPEDAGNRIGKIEVYDYARFIIMTGDVYEGRAALAELETKQIGSLRSKFGTKAAATSDLLDAPERFSDDDVVMAAVGHSDGTEFIRLFHTPHDQVPGDKSALDFVLANKLARWTGSFSQFLRLWERSGRWRPEKRNTIQKYHQHLFREFAKARHAMEGTQFHPHWMVEPVRAAVQNILAEWERERAKAVEEARRIAQELAATPKSPKATLDPLPEPPGLLAEVMNYIYKASPLPNREISLCGAIALMAGIIGRTYLTHTAMGLNQFLLLLVPTGGGKEAAKGGPDRLLAAVDSYLEQRHCATGGKPSDLFRPPLFNSGEGMKEIAKETPCAMILYPEFGKVLERAGGKSPPQHIAGIMNEMLEAYSANEKGRRYGGKRLSSKDKSSRDAIQPSLTVLADSQVSTFYNVLDNSFTASGLLPRFMFFEPDVSNPVPNDNLDFAPSPELVQRLADIVLHVMQAGANQPEVSPTHTVVQLDQQAGPMDQEFNRACIAHYSAMEEGLARDLWTRRRATVLKLAALAAVAAHPFNPLITQEEYLWAHEVVRRGQSLLLSRIEDGIVGSTSSLQRRAIIEVATDWVRKSPEEKRRELKGKGIAAIVDNGWLPVSWLSNRLDRRKPFSDEGSKARQAVRAALSFAVTDGWFIQVATDQKASVGIRADKELFALGDEFPR